MRNRTQRILSLVLALVMILGFASPVLAQVGELPGPKESITFNVNVTVNGLRGVVDGNVDFYLRGQAGGDWQVFEPNEENSVEIVDGEGTVEITIPETLTHDEDTEYDVDDLDNLHVWVGLREVTAPINDVYFGDHEEPLNPDYFDEYGDEVYWQSFPVEELDPTVPVEVNFDLVHEYPQISDDDFTIRVVDREGRGLEGAEVTLWKVEKGNEADYALDENGDYIVDEDADTWTLKEPPTHGYLVLSWQKNKQLLLISER